MDSGNRTEGFGAGERGRGEPGGRCQGGHGVHGPRVSHAHNASSTPHEEPSFSACLGPDGSLGDAHDFVLKS